MTKDQEQLQRNVECILDEYLNGMYDEPDQYPELTKEEARDYCITQIYNIRDYGGGHIKQRKGICDHLKFLGNNYIYSVIDEYAKGLGILKETATAD